MGNENEKLNIESEELQTEKEDSAMGFDELDELLQSKLEEELSGLEDLNEEFEQIGNPDALGETIKGVVWEQFLNQIAATAGEDFIKENTELLGKEYTKDSSGYISDLKKDIYKVKNKDTNNMYLDLSDDAHIQTAENFEQQKYARHNAYVNYEKRGERYREDFYTDPNNRPKAKQNQEQRFNEETQTWEFFDTLDEEWKKSLKPDYRKPYEEDRQKDKKNKFGSKSVNKDHQVADATIARDAEAGAYMTIDEKVKVANDEANLNDLDSAANQSKSDHDGEKWVKHKRTGKNGNGQTNGEYFRIDEEEYIEKDKKSKEAWNEDKEKKKQENIEAGKKSQKQEAFRIGGKALRAIVMQLLSELVKEIIGKMVLWFKSKNKSLNTLLDSIKTAIHSFVSKLKKHLVNATNTLLTTIATAIIGPVVSAIKKVWMMLKQGGKSIKNAIDFLRNPANKDMPIDIKLLEVGKIVIAGMTGAGAIVLGEVIEKGLMTIPPLAVEIPLIGSFANILGIFMGAVVAGIIGAIAIHMIDKATAKKRKELLNEDRVQKGNEILQTQRELHNVVVDKTNDAKKTSLDHMSGRHEMAAEYMREAVNEIFNDDTDEESEIVDEYKPASSSIDFDELDSALDDILGDNNE